ncbi:MAG: hypothetical protein SFX74_01610 [Fimbriimonadaceae bacterium]|nr:hypothetical protein [Fimbriimonadaceae bacterium]
MNTPIHPAALVPLEPPPLYQVRGRLVGIDQDLANAFRIETKRLNVLSDGA